MNANIEANIININIEMPKLAEHMAIAMPIPEQLEQVIDALYPMEHYIVQGKLTFLVNLPEFSGSQRNLPKNSSKTKNQNSTYDIILDYLKK